MKIKVTEIECNASELRQSNTLAESFATLLRCCFIPAGNNDDEEDSDDEQHE